MLKQEYKEPPTLKEALELAIKVLNKTLDSTKLNAEKGMIHLSTNVAYSTIPLLPSSPSTNTHTHPHTVEIATLTRSGEGKDAQTEIRVLPVGEVNTLIQDYMKKEEERKRAERKKEEKAKEEKAKAERAKAEKEAAAKTA